jgi:hypothetical protein
VSIATDLASITTGFDTKPVVFGSTKTRGRFTQRDRDVPDINGGSRTDREQVLLVPVAELATATLGDDITIDSIDYKVRDNRLIAGGHLREVIVA